MAIPMSEYIRIESLATQVLKELRATVTDWGHVAIAFAHMANAIDDAAGQVVTPIALPTDGRDA